MGQLRDTIRTMVRNEFADRMVAEATKVYHNSNYETAWKSLPLGERTDEISDTASKYDFMRWFNQRYLQPNGSLRITDEKYEQLKALLAPFKRYPSKFIDALNLNREDVFGASNYRDDADPVSKILDMYLEFKKMSGHLSKQTAFDNVKIDGGEEAAPAEGEEEGGYDVIPGTAKKSDIAKMLAADPTETTTGMSVTNRYRNAMKHLGNDVVVQLIEFLRDPQVDSSDHASVLRDLESLNKLVAKGTREYTKLFLACVIEAYKSVKDVENDAEVDDAMFDAKDIFIEKLKKLKVLKKSVNKETINPYEMNVFVAALNKDVEDDKTVNDLALYCAKQPANRDLVFDEMVAAAEEVFKKEADKRTNFNSLGDFIDAMEDVVKVRKNIFKTIEKRGRKAGSTKAVLAAKKAEASDTEEADEE